MEYPKKFLEQQKKDILERKIRFHAKEMFNMLKKLNEYAPNTCRDLKADDLLLKIEGGK